MKRIAVFFAGLCLSLNSTGVAMTAVAISVGMGLSTTAQAARVADLYTARLDVAEQTVQLSDAQVSEALRQIVIKVSGRTDSVSNARVKSALAQPKPYIQQFSYQQTDRPIANEQGETVSALELTIKFNGTLIEQLLNQAGLRPLGTERPSVLLWVIEEQSGRRDYVERGDGSILSTMLMQAHARGLPVVQPLLDLQDEAALPVSDAWGFFADSIRNASQRYQADAVMVGRVFKDLKGRWQSQWQVIWPQEVVGFEGDGSALDEQLSSAVNKASDYLFADFVRPANGFDEGGLQLVITGVNSIDDYFQITNYLRQLPAISQVAIDQLQADQLTLRLSVDGSTRQVQSAIGLNQRFVPQVSLSGLEPENAYILNYRWQH